MKKIFTKKIVLLSFGMFLMNISIKAQYALTNSSFAPAVGNTWYAYSADTTGIEPGVSGANKTWTYNITTTGGLNNLGTYITPSSGTSSGQFPTATIASSDGNGNYGYYNVNSSKMDLLGVVTSSGTQIVYSNPQTLYNFPFTYNSSNTDNFAANYNNGGYSMSRYGSSTSTGDGYGTLIVNGITYSNVLKVKIKQDISDEYIGLDYITRNIFNTYYFFNASSKNPIIYISYLDSYNIDPSWQDTTFLGSSKQVLISDFAAGINNIANSISSEVFPNPVVTKAYVTYQLTVSGKVSFEILNTLGQIVIRTETMQKQTGTNKEEIDLSELPSGSYFVRIITEKGSSVKKITH